MDVSLWSVLLLTSVFFLSGGCHEDCLLPLGMEDGRIKDENIRARSSLPLASPTNARLNHSEEYGGWCPDQMQYKNKTAPINREFIQIEFGTPLRVKGIVTQGRANGAERVEQYWFSYLGSEGTYEWYFEGNSHRLEIFEGNSQQKPQKKNILRPPVVTGAIRVHPQIFPEKQVCLRLELLGCSLKNGIVSYETLQGNLMRETYNFTDSSYDGLVKDNSLFGGLGMLTDGHLAPADYANTRGVGWIGWNAEDTPDPYIRFQFLNTRIFHSVTIHCNVRDEADVQLFSNVTIRFGEDVATFDKSLSFKPKQISSGLGWKNYNVTIDLCKHVGKFMELKFTHVGNWILISEISFNSDPLGKISPPLPKCASIPPLFTRPPTGLRNDISTSSPSDGVKGKTGKGTVTGNGSLSGGVIAAIICAVVAVLVAVALFICCKRYPHWFSQREKPFNSFIKVEVKPYARHHTPQRVSRLDSTASENEEKRYSFKNNVYNEAGGKRGAEVTICPIYASIQGDLNKGTMKSDEQNNIPKGERLYSEHKSSKKVKPPIPPPLKPPEPLSEVIYAEPNTPLLPSPTNGGSPKAATAQSFPQVDVTEESDVAYNDYAEPDSPCEKNRLIPDSPKPRVVSGYADPIDVISPTSVTTFPNPIYEEIYSEPFQGVSGTSLYCNPDEELNFRPRLDTFKELPRHKLHFKEKIGDGQFGEVHIGEVERLGDILGGEFKNSSRTTVAIKTLKLNVDKNIKDDFFKEVKAMAGLKHSNVIRLLGVCRDDPMCMIVEYMANGDLNQFLKEKEHTPSLNESEGWQDAGQYISSQALFYMAKQVAAGMKYISSLNYVHRDLATRNCLVGHANTVKIADFGMSRNLYSKHYYRVEGRVILPIRWMAPECILQGRFTTSSDVWAFGVTLWEILTLAKEYPYSELTDEEVIDNAQKIFHGTGTPSTRLPQPETCPDDLYQVMCRCWTREMEERPSFMELHSSIAERVRLSEVSMEC